MRCLCMILTLMFLFPFAVCEAETSNGFITGQFEMDGHAMPYALYVPSGIQEHAPMIVFLHGSHGRGNDINLVIDHGFPRFLLNGELGDVPALVLIPQLPEQADGWYQYDTQVMALIDEKCEQYRADPNRISLTGHSMGGIGTWDLSSQHPDAFSCIAPISGKLTADEQKLQILSDIPTRAYVGDQDIRELLQQDHIDLMNALDAVNPDFEFTIINRANHSQVAKKVYTAGSATYETDDHENIEMPELIVWMLEH